MNKADRKLWSLKTYRHSHSIIFLEPKHCANQIKCICLLNRPTGPLINDPCPRLLNEFRDLADFTHRDKTQKWTTYLHPLLNSCVRRAPWTWRSQKTVFNYHSISPPQCLYLPLLFQENIIPRGDLLGEWGTKIRMKWRSWHSAKHCLTKYLSVQKAMG